jgi:hypothetical protein
MTSLPISLAANHILISLVRYRRIQLMGIITINLMTNTTINHKMLIPANLFNRINETMNPIRAISTLFFTKSNKSLCSTITILNNPRTFLETKVRITNRTIIRIKRSIITTRTTIPLLRIISDLNNRMPTGQDRTLQSRHSYMVCANYLLFVFFFFLNSFRHSCHLTN